MDKEKNNLLFLKDKDNVKQDCQCNSHLLKEKITKLIIWESKAMHIAFGETELGVVLKLETISAFEELYTPFLKSTLS